MASRRSFIQDASALALMLPLRAYAGPADSSIRVKLSVSGEEHGTVDREYIGWSYEKKSMVLTPIFSEDNAALIRLWAPLGRGILRIGGNTVEDFRWNPHGRGRTEGEVAPADVDALARFARVTGRRILYAVNAGGATTPALAAAEVAYVKHALGENLFGIEVGNESDEYGKKYNKASTVGEYVALWREFRDAILRASSGVTLTGPATATSSHIDSWTIPFAEATQSQNGVITQHYYRGKGTTPEATAEHLVSPDLQLRNAAAKLQAESIRLRTPWRLTETNSYWAGGSPGASDSYASALWCLDHIFGSAFEGCSGVNFHCGNRTAYSAITDDAGRVTGIRPLYYGLRFAARAGSGTLLRTALTDVEGRNVSSYAIRRKDATLAVLINNKSSARLTVALELPSEAGSARSLLLTAPALSALDGVTIQGKRLGTRESFDEFEATPVSIVARSAAVEVPPLSALLVGTVQSNG